MKQNPIIGVRLVCTISVKLPKNYKHVTYLRIAYKRNGARM